MTQCQGSSARTGRIAASWSKQVRSTAALIIGLAALPGMAQPPGNPPGFTPPDYVVKAGPDFVAHMRTFGPDVQPVLPFAIVGNIYYVGTANTGSYLITGPQGHILIDTGPSFMLATLGPNIIKLGFDPKDVKYILIEHAHFDHVQGLAYMQRLTGAKIGVMGPDVRSIESGKDTSSLHVEGWEPVKVDRVLKNGDVISVGPVSVKAIWTPGHTQGATSYLTTAQDGGRPYTVLFGGPPTPFVGDKRWATAPTDAEASFSALRAITPDIVLPGHPARVFDGKIEAMRAGTRPHPLQLQPADWQKMVADADTAYRKRLATAAQKPAG